MAYHPKGGQSVPYVYFFNNGGTYGQTFTGTGTGTAHPYKRDNGTFVNDKSYQILSAGQDGNWGANSADKRFPSGQNYGPGDGDNVTNFSEGTLADEIP